MKEELEDQRLDTTYIIMKYKKGYSRLFLALGTEGKINLYKRNRMWNLQS